MAESQSADKSVASVPPSQTKYNGKDDVHQLLEQLAADTDHVIDVVCLEGNSFSREAFEAVCHAIADHGDVFKLVFRDIFTGRLNEEMHPALVTMSKLLGDLLITHLDLSDNAISRDGARALLAFFKTNTTLKHLLLNNTGVGPVGATALARGLTLAAQRGMKLSQFILGRSRLENEGASALAICLGEMGELQVLDVPQNGIRPTGIANLATDCIARSPHLKKLNLNDNTCARKGGLALGAAISALEHIEHVDLGDCLLRNQGAEAVLGALSSRKTLKFLDLSYNDMTPLCTPLVVKVVEANPDLSHLNLNGNKFNEESIEDLKSQLDDLGRPDILQDVDEMDSDEEEEEAESDEEEDDEEEHTHVHDAVEEAIDKELEELMSGLSM